MARLDHDAGGPIPRQEWRGKRLRHEDSNEALARALLETVRQALDEGADDDTGVGTPTHSQTSSQRDRQAQHADGSLADGGVEALPSGGSGALRDVKSGHGAGLWQSRGGGSDGHEEVAAEDRAPDGAEGGPVLARGQDGQPSATNHQRPNGDNDLQSPQQGLAQGTASFDSATTTLNTGEGPVEGQADDAADPEGSTADEGAAGSARKKNAAAKVVLPGGPCAHCGTTESPQWRRPLTRKVVLCNACGIYFSRHHSLPKRKKVIYSAVGRLSKQDQTALRKDPAQSIICEEELEYDEQMPQPAVPARGARKPSRAAAARQLNDLQRGVAHRLDAGAELGQHTGMSGSDPKTLEPPRKALSLPLMTALPVVGGINVIVQSFLSKTFTNR